MMPDTLGDTIDDYPGTRAMGESRLPLCERCRNFDIHSFTRVKSRRRAYLLCDIEAAAHNCEFCSLLLEILEDTEKPKYFYFNFWKLETTFTNVDFYVHMSLSQDCSHINKKQSTSLPLSANRLLVEIGDRSSKIRNSSDHELCLAADAKSLAGTSGDISGRYLGGNPASDEHYATIQNWIKGCSNHPKCNQTVSGSSSIDAYRSPLPARCIEISEDHKMIYLRETEGQFGAYITLTHRWNQETEDCKTTSSNYNNQRLGREVDTLPQLFQDVFIISKNLAVRYVWIDSLCIIQQGDDGVDWRREAPKMAEYYQFSLLTIAGTMTDMRKGLLCPYPDDVRPWASRPVRLPYRDDTGAQKGHFYVFRRKHTLVDDYMTTVRNSSLFQRGWILQEWLLSKRLIWYTPHGLFFECHTNMPSTDGQETISAQLAKGDLPAQLNLKPSFHFTCSSILDFWYHALDLYSACHLTKPSDRILAMAGLANEVGEILKRFRHQAENTTDAQDEAYLSGLWLRDIHHGLLWEEDHSANSWNTRVTGAPSWSWSSIMTPVKWPERKTDVQQACKITGICLRRRDDKHSIPDIHVTTTAQSATPGLQWPKFDTTNMSACLHIRGKLCILHVRGYLGTRENLHTAAFSTAYNPIPADCKWRALCTPTMPELIVGWGSLEQLRMEEAGCADFGVAVYALHVSTRYLHSGLVIKRAEPVLEVLLLEEVEAGSHVYRRVGVGRVADYHLVELREGQSQDVQII